MENNVKVKVKIQAYERGILPTRLGQLANDVPYATQTWTKNLVKEYGGFPSQFDGGNIQNKDQTVRVILDGGEISNTSDTERFIINCGEVGA